jgi:hypothetical protein
MRSYWRLLTIFSVNITIFLVGIIALELIHGKWLKTKTFVPNILPKHGISHDLSLLGGNSGVTTRVPDDNGAILYSTTNNRNHKSGEDECSILVLGGSTAEERILNRNETWSYRLFSDLNMRDVVQRACRSGVSVTNAAVNGHSIVANYFDVVYWISRFKRKYNTAVIYQGINDFQGDLLQEPDWYDIYWQHLVYGLRYNSILLRLLETLSTGDFKWENSGGRVDKGKAVLVMPYPEDRSAWKRYYLKTNVYQRLSVGLDHHARYIRLLAEALKRLGVSHTVWITQTKPFCRLEEMPNALVVRGSKTSQAQLDNVPALSDQELRSWFAHDRLGDCIRLGLVRSSYLQSSSILDRMGIRTSVVDYGSLSETNPGSYDEYHKTPDGSLALWKELVRMGLLNKIVDHFHQQHAP